jgi:hypothetical protein
VFGWIHAKGKEKSRKYKRRASYHVEKLIFIKLRIIARIVSILYVLLALSVALTLT